MRIGIQTWGSYGDVRPFLALAAGLSAAGHDVTLNVSGIDGADYSFAAEVLGITVRKVADIDVNRDERLVQLGRQVIASRNPVKQLRIIIDEFLAPHAEEIYQAACELCQSHDLLIGHGAVYPIQAAAAKTGVDYTVVHLFHGLFPTATRPPIIGLPNWGKWCNQALWALLNSVVNLLLKGNINRFRQAHGLSPIRDCTKDVWTSRQLNLIGVSGVFCDHPGDWGPEIKVCGYFDLPALQPEGDVTPELQAFIDGGEAPVYMGFGSMMQPELTIQQETMAIFVEAVKRSGSRAIIQASLWRECGYQCNQQIHFVSSSPHGRIFPQCRAVVHHGGSGTTQAVTKSGVPSIVVMHFGDQLGWAIETQRLGIGVKPLWRNKMTAKNLADRIQSVSPDMAARAKQLGQIVRQENGVASAVAAVEEKFGRAGQAPKPPAKRPLEPAET